MDQNTNCNAHFYSYMASHTDKHAHCNTYFDLDTDPNTDKHADRNAYFDLDTNPNADKHAHTAYGLGVPAHRPQGSLNWYAMP